jgi:hypothetical protein
MRESTETREARALGAQRFIERLVAENVGNVRDVASGRTVVMAP